MNRENWFSINVPEGCFGFYSYPSNTSITQNPLPNTDQSSRTFIASIVTLGSFANPEDIAGGRTVPSYYWDGSGRGTRPG
ncbi:MAG: hypothetical protein EBS19_06605, partial [Spirochaetia bacterium]|nr:hypothetical protein [Spirochaetia bacterium]